MVEEKTTDDLIDYIRTLKPQPFVYDNLLPPDYLRIWIEYAQLENHGHQKSILLPDIMKKVMRLHIPDRTLKSYEGNRSALLYALVMYNKDSINDPLCISSISNRIENQLDGTLGTGEDDAISDIIIEASQPNLNITFGQEVCPLPVRWTWSWRAEDNKYVYRPLDVNNRPVFEFPYILPIYDMCKLGYGNLKILVRDKNHNRVGYNVEFIRHWFPTKLREQLKGSSILTPVSPYDYFLLQRLITPVKDLVSIWKKSDEGKKAIARTEYKKLSFLMCLHKKDQSSAAKHFRGHLGERRVLRLILSHLSDIDI